MAGTKAGGQRAAATNKRKYGDDYYANIGIIGGKLGHTGGFYVNRELARIAGAKGGSVSRRRPGKLTDEQIQMIRKLGISTRQSDIAQQFNISIAHVSRIIQGKSYKHIG